MLTRQHSSVPHAALCIGDHTEEWRNGDGLGQRKWSIQENYMSVFLEPLSRHEIIFVNEWCIFVVNYDNSAMRS